MKFSKNVAPEHNTPPTGTCVYSEVHAWLLRYWAAPSHILLMMHITRMTGRRLTGFRGLLDMAAAAALVCIAALSSSELATVTPVTITVLSYRH